MRTGEPSVERDNFQFWCKLKLPIWRQLTNWPTQGRAPLSSRKILFAAFVGTLFLNPEPQNGVKFFFPCAFGPFLLRSAGRLAVCRSWRMLHIRLLSCNKNYELELQCIEGKDDIYVFNDYFLKMIFKTNSFYSIDFGIDWNWWTEISHQWASIVLWTFIIYNIIVPIVNSKGVMLMVFEILLLVRVKREYVFNCERLCSTEYLWSLLESFFVSPSNSDILQITAIILFVVPSKCFKQTLRST